MCNSTANLNSALTGGLNARKSCIWRRPRHLNVKDVSPSETEVAAACSETSSQNRKVREKKSRKNCCCRWDMVVNNKQAFPRAHFVNRPSVTERICSSRAVKIDRSISVRGT